MDAGAAPALTTHVGVFWDYENVRIPREVRPSRAASAIRDAVLPFGQIIERRIYYDSRKASELSTNRVCLDQSGFTLVDCPTRGTKETLDKKLIVDVMHFAHMMRKPSCVVLVTSDGDYSYTLAKIGDLGVRTVVIYGPESTTPGVLIDNADVAMSWLHDVLPEDSDDDAAASSSAADESRGGGVGASDDDASASPARDRFQAAAHDAMDGAHVLLCHCIAELSAPSRAWVLLGHVGAAYYRKRGHGRGRVGPADRAAFSRSCSSALRGGFVETSVQETPSISLQNDFVRVDASKFCVQISSKFVQR